jgi:L-alanine-DL-glutamate epimerase-like enolase superfamily enzyme
MPKNTDITIRDVRLSFEEFPYRTALKFGGVVTTHCILMNIAIDVENGSGKTAEGFGSMPLGNAWSFPSKKVSFDETLDAMVKLAEAIAARTAQDKDAAHPVDIMTRLEPEFLDLAEQVGRDLSLADPIPKLCTLVTASPVDAALHDAFGKAAGINSYDGLGADHMNHSLETYLNSEFEGEYLDQYTSRQPKSELPLYHLVGALDPLTDADIDKRLDDGIPETLPEWIVADGLTHLKIKLNGDDLDWDVNRVCSIQQVTEETQAKRNVTTWSYSLDFNEQCQNVEYLLEFLAQIQEKSPGAFDRTAYVEQPTARDLKANPENKMHKAAQIRPVVIDESLQDFESLLMSRDLGYSGVALKACKGQSQALLMGAAAQKYGMFLCVQDLTCPGASFLHSAGLAARVPSVTAIEGNARQFCPNANDAWRDQYPGIFNITTGTVNTGSLTGPGLGH